MEAPKRQGWRITVRAKFKGLDLRLSASNVLPCWGSGGERVSFFLRLRRRFFLRVKSENQSPASRVPAARSAAPPLAKPFEFLKKTFRRQRWFSRNNAASKSDSKLSVVGFLSAISKQYRRQGLAAIIIGSLSLLSRSAYEKDHKGIAIHAFASLLNLIVLLRMGRLNLSLLVVAGIFAIFGSSLSYLTYVDYLPMIAWRVWSYIFTFGYMVVTSQQNEHLLSFLKMKDRGISTYGFTAKGGVEDVFHHEYHRSRNFSDYILLDGITVGSTAYTFYWRLTNEAELQSMEIC